MLLVWSEVRCCAVAAPLSLAASILVDDLEAQPRKHHRHSASRIVERTRVAVHEAGAWDDAMRMASTPLLQCTIWAEVASGGAGCADAVHCVALRRWSCRKTEKRMVNSFRVLRTQAPGTAQRTQGRQEETESAPSALRLCREWRRRCGMGCSGQRNVVQPCVVYVVMVVRTSELKRRTVTRICTRHRGKGRGAEGHSQHV